MPPALTSFNPDAQQELAWAMLRAMLAHIDLLATYARQCDEAWTGEAEYALGRAEVARLLSEWPAFAQALPEIAACLADGSPIGTVAGAGGLASILSRADATIGIRRGPRPARLVLKATSRAPRMGRGAYKTWLDTPASNDEFRANVGGERLLAEAGWTKLKSGRQYSYWSPPRYPEADEHIIVDVDLPTMDEIVALAEHAHRLGFSLKGQLYGWPWGYASAIDEFDSDHRPFYRSPSFAIGEGSWGAQVRWAGGQPHYSENTTHLKKPRRQFREETRTAYRRIRPILRRINQGAGFCEDRGFAWGIEQENEAGRELLAHLFEEHAELREVLPEVAHILHAGTLLGDVMSFGLPRVDEMLRYGDE